MTRTPAIWAALLLLTGFSVPQVEAARLASAPTIDLTSGYHLVMIARVAALVDPTHVEMERIQSVHGETDGFVRLRADEATVATIEPGKTYIVAYARLMKHPQYREMKVIDPDGPRIVTLRHTGTKALFEDSPDTRLLFDIARDQDGSVAGRRMTAILQQMQRPDARSRALVIAEFKMRRELHPRAGPVEQKIIANVLVNKRLNTATRNNLLETALAFSPQQRGPWFTEVCRTIADQSGSRLELATQVPGLVRTALRGLALTGDSGDVPRVTVHLRSNAPGVAKAALEALDALDQEAAATAVAAVLRDGSMHLETKRVFEAYLRDRVG